ncbi:MAG: lysophospholipid acyltransferase family protein [Candidatus Nitrotoga sp.]
MRSFFVICLFNLTARLPLKVLHQMGVMLGWITFYCSPTYAHRLRKNLVGAGLNRAGQNYSATEINAILRANIAEMGKSVSELPWVWCRPLHEVLRSVQACSGLKHVEAARARGQGVIILTPHLGCFEMIALYLAERVPMTSMYRPPRLVWLDQITRLGRGRGQMSLAKTDIGGVRALYKTLKRGNVIGVLPDQVPTGGEGEWANFFGHPAYTMTLVGRLMKSCNAVAMMCYSERLPDGKGYIIRISPLEFNINSPVTQQINAALEQVIACCPTQYSWAYNRYKIPPGVTPPDSTIPLGSASPKPKKELAT